ncbi:MAG: trypsin-like peptidase domain-containing protein [Xanthobacteraceae bacterium]
MARYRSFVASAILVFLIVPHVHASGPLGTIRVGTWFGGAFTNNNTGTFSHCAAAQPYGSGVTLTVGESSDRTWLVGFTDPSVNFPKGATFPIDITFDGQAQFHLVAVASSPVVAAAVLPDAAVSQFRKSQLMVLQGKTHTLQFPLSSTDNLAMVIENCVTRMNDGGLSSVGDFSVSAKKSITPTKPAVPFRQARSAEETAPAGSPRLTNVSGTGFVISTEGHIVTNNHVIKDCVGDVQGNFVDQAPTTLRVVATDEINDLALLQAKEAKKTFKEPAMMREMPVRSGDAVIAIGFPYHGLLTSDFTVTTGIVSSLSGILNDTRFLQISAPVQPGNSGGPLLDMSGHVVGVVSAKLNALKFAKATGDIPENINFAIKTGTVRDFLDNSAVPYDTELTETELKTAEIASAARAYIMLISCTANEREAGRK